MIDSNGAAAAGGAPPGRAVLVGRAATEAAGPDAVRRAVAAAMAEAAAMLRRDAAMFARARIVCAEPWPEGGNSHALRHYRELLGALSGSSPAGAALVDGAEPELAQDGCARDATRYAMFVDGHAVEVPAEWPWMPPHEAMTALRLAIGAASHDLAVPRTSALDLGELARALDEESARRNFDDGLHL